MHLGFTIFKSHEKNVTFASLSHAWTSLLFSSAPGWSSFSSQPSRVIRYAGRLRLLKLLRVFCIRRYQLFHRTVLCLYSV